MLINIKYDLTQLFVISLPLALAESEFIGKRVFVKTHHEIGEFISTIFFRNKSDGAFKVLLNLKKLNKNF